MDKADLIYKYISRVSTAKLRLQANPTPTTLLETGVRLVSASVRLKLKMQQPRQKHQIGGM